jgi:hypothetical protein
MVLFLPNIFAQDMFSTSNYTALSNSTNLEKIYSEKQSVSNYTRMFLSSTVTNLKDFYNLD